MTKASTKDVDELPKTMSADQTIGVANSNEDRHERTWQGKDHGIRPDDLSSENAQGVD